MSNAQKIFAQIITGDEFKDYRKEFADKKYSFLRCEANAFFIFVMLDHGMQASRAWQASRHFVDTHFPNSSIWNDIAKKRIDSLKKICQNGYNDKSYPPKFKFNTFHEDIKENAKIMIRVYDGDPRNIWDVSKENVEEIYTRFKQFNGIGDALARMAQFILVRDKGVAGGIESKQYLKIKPDIHVNKVLFRMGLSETESANSTKKCVDDAEVSSQADLDLVLFKVGRKFCLKNNPKCTECPLKKLCKKVGT